MYPKIANDANLHLITLSDSLNHLSEIMETKSIRNDSQYIQNNYKVETVSMDFIYDEQ